MANKPNIKQNLKNHAKRTRDFLLNLLFPIECLGCGEPDAWLCENCFKKLSAGKKPYCLSCYAETAFGEFCADCRKKFFLDGVMVAGDYDDKLLAKVIKNFKYDFNQAMGPLISEYMARYFKNLRQKQTMMHKNDLLGFLLKTENTVIIPIPLHKTRLRWRGFNQAELIAEKLCKKFNFPLETDFLIRAKNNTAQAKLKGKKRYENLQNAFDRQKKDFSYRNVILVDDIVTTGTTLNECAKILKQAGAQEVWGLVAAKG